MKDFFVATIYNPLYNIFVAIIDIIPTHEVFWAAIVFTVLVKLVLFPLTKSAMLSQIKIRGIQDELKRIQVEFKDQREVLATKMLSLYRENNINPLSPILVLLVQIPVVLSLFFIFKSGLPEINLLSLYSFVPAPEAVQMVTFGIDLAEKSIPLALLTGITQYFYTKRTFAHQLPVANSDKKSGQQNFGAEFQKAMSFQFTYVMPVIITIVAYSFASVLAIYWITSNVFAYLQDVYIRRQIDNQIDDSVVPEVVSVK